MRRDAMEESICREFDKSKLNAEAKRILDKMLEQRYASIEHGKVFVTLELDEEGFQRFFLAWKETKHQTE